MNRKLIVIALAGALAAAGLVIPALAGPTGGGTRAATPATAQTTAETGPQTTTGWTCPGWTYMGEGAGPMGMHGAGWTRGHHAMAGPGYAGGPMHRGGYGW